MSNTLYITDLDGTLLDDTGHVSARSAEIISRLSRQGVLISVATARTPATVVELLRDTYTTADLVVMTGAGIWDRPGHRFRSLALIPEEQVRRMMQVFHKRDLHPFCYTLSDNSHLDVYRTPHPLNVSESLFIDQRRGLALKTFHLDTPCPDEAASRVVLFFGMGSRDTIVSVAEELRDITDCYVSYYKDTYTDDLWLLEIFAHGVSKANGIRHLRDMVKADRLVVFGDNLNDIPMMREADVAVAVENALPEVKAIADVVIGPNTADAVALFIEEDSRQ